MIIKKNGLAETRSDKPNSDWYNNGNLIIDETAEEGKQMAQTYIENYPFVNFEHDGEFVTKVIVLDKPVKPPEVEGKEIKLVKDETDQWVYIYVDIPKTETEEQQEIINTLGQELALL
uniref:hypothetical protein n=1 Tax=Gudongella sp. SC589 TaxID=3385990 RepID=UPI003904D836